MTDNIHPTIQCHKAIYDAYNEQIHSTIESDNPWIGMLMKSLSGDASIKESMTDEVID